MKNIDDILYPYYLEYNNSRTDFYNKHHLEICKLYNDWSNGGRYWFRFTKAKNGDYCFSVSAVYDGRLILNRVGYKTLDIALMSMIDFMHKGF